MPIEVIQCEHCQTEKPVETSSLMEGCWICAECYAAFKQGFDACAHDWMPYMTEFGEDAVICHRCSGVTLREDLPLIAA